MGPFDQRPDDAFELFRFLISSYGCTADHCPRPHRPKTRSQRHPRSSAARSPLAQTVFVVMEPHIVSCTTGSRVENAFTAVLQFALLMGRERKKFTSGGLNLMLKSTGHSAKLLSASRPRRVTRLSPKVGCATMQRLHVHLRLALPHRTWMYTTLLQLLARAISLQSSGLNILAVRTATRK